MSERDGRKVTETSASSIGNVQASFADLLAFLGVLVLVGGLAFLLDRTARLSAQVALAWAAGLAANCANAWRRLRRAELRRWHSGHVEAR